VALLGGAVPALHDLRSLKSRVVWKRCMSNRAVCRHNAESHTLNIPYMHLVALEGMPRLSLRRRAHVLARAPGNVRTLQSA